ncbi:MAG: hypothetical protein KME26_16675 [Oscillatoria princeps RMCB-10]|nr:hypothetical protein [Oscillatoria princeps RMCB-10]
MGCLAVKSWTPFFMGLPVVPVGCRWVRGRVVPGGAGGGWGAGGVGWETKVAGQTLVLQDSKF